MANTYYGFIIYLFYKEIFWKQYFFWKKVLHNIFMNSLISFREKTVYPIIWKNVIIDNICKKYQLDIGI